MLLLLLVPPLVVDGELMDPCGEQGLIICRGCFSEDDELVDGEVRVDVIGETGVGCSWLITLQIYSASKLLSSSTEKG